VANTSALGCAKTFAVMESLPSLKGSPPIGILEAPLSPRCGASSFCHPPFFRKLLSVPLVDPLAQKLGTNSHCDIDWSRQSPSRPPAWGDYHCAVAGRGRSSSRSDAPLICGGTDDVSTSSSAIRQGYRTRNLRTLPLSSCDYHRTKTAPARPKSRGCLE